MVEWQLVATLLIADRRLAEVWVKLSSQYIIMTDDLCENTMLSHSMASERGRYPKERWDYLGVSKNSRGRPNRDNLKKNCKIFFWMRYETTAQSLCKRRRELEQTESGCWEMTLVKRQEQTNQCQNCAVNTGVYQPSLLLSRDIATFSLSLVVEVLLYVHRNRRLIRDGSPGRLPRLSHSP